MVNYNIKKLITGSIVTIASIATIIFILMAIYAKKEYEHKKRLFDKKSI